MTNLILISNSIETAKKIKYRNIFSLLEASVEGTNTLLQFILSHSALKRYEALKGEEEEEKRKNINGKRQRNR